MVTAAAASLYCEIFFRRRAHLRAYREWVCAFSDLFHMWVFAIVRKRSASVCVVSCFLNITFFERLCDDDGVRIFFIFDFTSFGRFFFIHFEFWLFKFERIFNQTTRRRCCRFFALSRVVCCFFFYLRCVCKKKYIFNRFVWLFLRVDDDDDQKNKYRDVRVCVWKIFGTVIWINWRRQRRYRCHLINKNITTKKKKFCVCDLLKKKNNNFMDIILCARARLKTSPRREWIFRLSNYYQNKL